MQQWLILHHKQIVYYRNEGYLVSGKCIFGDFHSIAYSHRSLSIRGLEYDRQRKMLIFVLSEISTRIRRKL